MFQSIPKVELNQFRFKSRELFCKFSCIRQEADNYRKQRDIKRNPIPTRFGGVTVCIYLLSLQVGCFLHTGNTIDYSLLSWLTVCAYYDIQFESTALNNNSTAGNYGAISMKGSFSMLSDAGFFSLHHITLVQMHSISRTFFVSQSLGLYDQL